MSEPGPTITRRAMLGSAAAAGAGALLGPVAGAAAQAVGARGAVSPGGRAFSRWVGRVDGASAVFDAPRRFALAGLQWSAPGHVRIELRTRVRGGPWGAWTLASVTGHDGDGAVSSSTFGEPVWVGSGDMAQLRSSRPVEGLRMHFVAREATAGSVARQAQFAGPVLDAGPGQPQIIARSVWAGDHAPPEFASAFYGTIKMAFVHHTVNANGYSLDEVPALLLAIFDYHRYVRGFFDIAYNFIIDHFGQIWEARAGGISEPVIGAHAGGYNAESTGVAVLGTFSAVVPPPAAIDALEHLLAWKLALHGIPSVGKVGVVVSADGAIYTPFPPFAHVTLPRVAGHRDGCTTDCPGNAFYYALPSIRPRIAGLEGTPAVLTLTAPSKTIAPATQLALSGELSMLNGAPIAGAPVQLQQLSNDQATTVAAATTSADGSWSATVTVYRNMVLRALHAIGPVAASANAISVSVRPVVTLVLASQSPIRVSGTITPAKPRVTLDIYRLVNGHRRLIAHKTVRAFGGRFSARALVSGRPGSYVIVARTAPGGGTIAGASAPLRVSI
jgi:hypothetical protein